MMSRKLPRSIYNHRRLFIISGVIIVTLGLIGAYSFWSMSAWETYRLSYVGWQEELRSDMDSAITLPAGKQQERARKMSALKDVSTDIIKAQGSLCASSVHYLIGWQHFMSTLKEREDACRQIVTAAGRLGEELQAAMVYLENEQKLADIITTAAGSQTTVTETTWGSQIAAWQEAGGAIKKMSVSPDFTPVKDSTLENIRLVGAAWRQLDAAHKAKNKTEYLRAQTQLTSAYKSLREVTVRVGEQQLAKLADSLQTAYDAVFDSKL
jgi:hypothetical protein